MRFIRSHRLVAVQLHQVIPDLFFAYRVKDFAPSTRTDRIRNLREVRSLAASEDKGKELGEYLSLPVTTSSPFSLTGVDTL